MFLSVVKIDENTMPMRSTHTPGHKQKKNFPDADMYKHCTQLWKWITEESNYPSLPFRTPPPERECEAGVSNLNPVATLVLEKISPLIVEEILFYITKKFYCLLFFTMDVFIC